MQTYRWPGNVRELENCIERAVVLCRDNVVELEDLPDLLRTETGVSSGIGEDGQILPLKRALEDPERAIIERTLRACEWNRQKAAALLEINRTTLYMKMKKYGLENPPEGIA